jgi:hypothetical protein
LVDNFAEGQFAYIEATNTTQVYDGAARVALGAKVLQVLAVQKTMRLLQVARRCRPYWFDAYHHANIGH